MNSVGIDLHRKRSHVAVFDEHGRVSCSHGGSAGWLRAGQGDEADAFAVGAVARIDGFAKAKGLSGSASVDPMPGAANAV